MEIRIATYVNSCNYWFSLATALYYAGTKVCLHIFHDKTSATGLPKDRKLLYQCLLRHKEFLEKLRENNVLSSDEWELLFNEDEEVDSSKIDLGLLITLLQAISLPEPMKGWLSFNEFDFSTSGLLVKLKNIKDKITKISKPSNLSSFEYSALWDELSRVLDNLNYDIKQIDELHQTSIGDCFTFSSKNASKEFSKAFNRAKILYIEKSLQELKVCYTKHLENLCTVVSVVPRSKIDNIETNALHLKKVIIDLENKYDDLKRSRYKHAKKFLQEQDRIFKTISDNEKAIDTIIISYNKDLDGNSEELAKNQTPETDKKTIRRSFKKADVAGWFRNNTIKISRISRRHSNSVTNLLSDHRLQDPSTSSNNVVDLGEY